MWLEDGRSGIAPTPRERAALEAGGAAPQTPSAPRRAGGAVDPAGRGLRRPTPDDLRPGATGRAGSFFFEFCKRAIGSARSAREEQHVHSRRQEEDQTGIK
jgi:hypothetical protein